MRTVTRVLAAAGVASGAVLLTAGPVLACGGLVGENGSISLLRTTTLAAWHDGIEHYVTSFEFSGTGESVGSIIPLPAEPIDVVRGGDWTLQRLRLEVSPPLATASGGATTEAVDAAGVEILLQTEIDALDITVLSGGGDAVGQWAIDNGFLLTPDTPEVLDFYAERSPVFLAAKFDASRAAEQGLGQGQGTPVHITMETPRPWVPLRILGLGLDADELVQADVFLLTDDKPQLLAGGRGLDLERRELASGSLLADLRSDVGMEWVPDSLWLTHLTLDEQAGDLDYDLSASGEGTRPSAIDAGLELTAADRPVDAVDPAAPASPNRAVPMAVLGVGAVAIVVATRGVAAEPLGPLVNVGARVAAAGTILVAVGTLGVVAAGSSTPVDDGAALGPGRATVTLGIEHSTFSTDRIVVEQGTSLAFVVENGDPIGHELIVGPPEVHERHANGTEASHPPVPGEVTVPALETASTSYTFDEPGTFEFACHLPGHLAYGMTGVVVVE